MRLIRILTNPPGAWTQNVRRIHEARTDQSWLTPLPRSRGIAIVALALLLLAAAANLYVRHMQQTVWQLDQETSYFAGAPSFSTTDAPYFLKLAHNLKNGDPKRYVEELRSFPNFLNDEPIANTDYSARHRHLIAGIIAFLSPSNDVGSFVTAGNQLVLICAVLSIFMIAATFGAAGYWLEGAAAALGGCLSSAFLVRSSFGRIDTDMLNLGFIYLVLACVIAAGRSPSKLRCLIFCVAGGLASNAFMWWYPKPELIWVCFAALIWILFVSGQRLVLVAAAGGAFLATSGIASMYIGTSLYGVNVLTYSLFKFPNTLDTVSEVVHLSAAEILVSALGSVEMGLVGLVGLLIWTIRHPVMAVTLSPLLGLAGLNFLIGSRAVFYGAPLLWFGVAFLISTLCKFLTASLANNTGTPGRNQIATSASAFLALILAWVNSPTDYVPRPSFPKPVLEGLASLKTSVDRDNSVVATWWDYGYASMFFNELPTFHDGGTHTTPSTHFVARAFLDQEMADTIGALKFLSTRGHAGIAGETNLTSLNTAFRGALSSPSPDLYLIVTNQMAGWMGSISKIGNWDIERGEPIQLPGNPDGAEVHYKPINCRFNGYPAYLNCNGVRIDLERGLIGDEPLLVGWAHTQDGGILRRRDFAHDADHAIQIVQDGSRITAYLLHRQLYESTFNKLYHQGAVEHPTISLHYDDYPHIRIYRVDGSPTS